MTPPKKTPTPKPAPVIETPTEKRFRVRIITRKETIKTDLPANADATLLAVLEVVGEQIVSQKGYLGVGKDGLNNDTDKVLRWIPLHMIEQVEVTEITEDGK